MLAEKFSWAMLGVLLRHRTIKIINPHPILLLKKIKMIQVIRADKRFKNESDWLSSYWLFSFANYSNKDNVSFGNLRVFNDETIKAGKGYKRHEHKNMEIVTIPLEGEITHSDSIGNRVVLKPGDVQRISTGSGISHAEMNFSNSDSRFLQLWFFPSSKDSTPTYTQKSISFDSTLVPLVSGKDNANLAMDADATVYLGTLQKGEKINYMLDKDRRAFIYVLKGSLQFDNIETIKPKFDYREERKSVPMKLVLQSGDQARISEKETINLLSQEAAKFILVDT